MTSRKPSRKGKKVKSVKAWALMLDDGSIRPLFNSRLPALYESRNQARERGYGIGKPVRVTIRIEPMTQTPTPVILTDEVEEAWSEALATNRSCIDLASIRPAMLGMLTTITHWCARALEAERGWRSISEAPRDGQRLICSDGKVCWMDRFNDVFEIAEIPQWNWDGHQATHFMLLPSPPSAAALDKEGT